MANGERQGVHSAVRCGTAYSLALAADLPCTRSGKSFVSQGMIEAAAAIRARCDVERKRLFGLGALQSSRNRVLGGIGDENTTARTSSALQIRCNPHEHLLAGVNLAVGFPENHIPVARFLGDLTMSTPDFFRSRLDQMIDLRHPLAVLSTRLPWASIEAAVAPKLAHQSKPAKRVIGEDSAGAFEGEFGGGISPAGRPRLPIRLMISLLYLKNSFNLSDEEFVERWAENVQWQFFGGMEYYEPRLPCDATQIGRFRRLLGEDGLEQLFKATIECAVDTVQSKALAHPVDSC